MIPDLKPLSRLLVKLMESMMLLLLFSLFTLPAYAQESNLNFRSLMIRLLNDQKDHFQPEEIKKLFENSNLEFEVKAVASYFQHKEWKLNYNQFLSDDSIKKARQYEIIHQICLHRAEKEFGVDKNVITAIMLVETRLGKRVGSSPVMNVLATMAALEDPDIRESFWKEIPKRHRIPKKEYEIKAIRKAKWAYGELKAFIKYVNREGLDPFSINGSYAGAMGFAQFMPSNVLAFAKDGNNDGHINMFRHEDAIFSIANFLKQYGWKPGLSRKQAADVVYHYNNSKYYVNTILKIRDKLKG